MQMNRKNSDHNRLMEGEGVHTVGLLASKLGYLFRQTREYDKGIDGELELTQSFNINSLVSPVIKLQIKARSEFRLTSKNQIAITITKQNLDYWKRAGHPVLLMAYSNDVVYWMRVDNATSRTIKISLNQIFDENSLYDFIQIISQYYIDLARTTPLESVSDILADIGSTVGTMLTTNTKKIKEANEHASRANYKDASRIYEALAVIYEESSPILYNWSVALLGLHQLEKAIEVANEVQKKAPNKWQVYILLGACYIGLGQYDRAESFLATSLQFTSSLPLAWNMLGSLHYWQGLNEKAIKEFRQAITYAPKNPAAYYHIALCSTALGKYEDALDCYDFCIAIEPNLYDAYNNKALLLKHLWRLEEALEHFQKAISIEPENHMALYNYAYLLKDLGLNEQSILYYQRALEASPNSNQIHNDLGLLYCRVENTSKAEYHFQIWYNNEQGINPEKLPTVAIFDVGYAVVYMISLQILEDAVQIISVDDWSELALLSSPFFQWYAKHAHAFNMPLNEEVAREPFLHHEPSKVSEIVFDAPFFLNIDSLINHEHEADK